MTGEPSPGISESRKLLYKNKRVPYASLPGIYYKMAFQIPRQTATCVRSCRPGKTVFRKKGWEQGEDKVEV